MEDNYFELLKRAKMGDAASQYELAECYHNGAGVKKDLRKWMLWTSRSAEQGNSLALVTLEDEIIPTLNKIKSNFEKEGKEYNCQNTKTWLEMACTAADRGRGKDIAVLDVPLNASLDSDFKQSLNMSVYDTGEVKRAASPSPLAPSPSPLASNSFNQSSMAFTTVELEREPVPMQSYAPTVELPVSRESVSNTIGTIAGASGSEKANLAKSLHQSLLLEELPTPKCEEARVIMELGARGDAEAQNMIGCAYRSGKLGFVEDKAKAASWFKLSADNNFPPAMANIATCYEDGVGVPRDHAKSLQYFIEAAKHNIYEANYALGHKYYSGAGVCKDYDRAAKYLLKAVEQKDTPKEYLMLSTLAMQGKGLNQDIYTAVRWCIKSAMLGENDARKELNETIPILYPKLKDGVERRDNLEYATRAKGLLDDIDNYINTLDRNHSLVVMCEKLKEQDDLAACIGNFNATQSQEGEFKGVSSAMAANKIETSELQGFGGAASGEFFPENETKVRGAVGGVDKATIQQMLDGTDKPEEVPVISNIDVLLQKAREGDIKPFIASAEGGCNEAAAYLGGLYKYAGYNGLPIDEDSRLATLWIKKAAVAGVVHAQAHIALCYEDGYGVECDETKAIEYYHKAAEQGHAFSMARLALCYKKGFGVRQSNEKADAWINKALDASPTYMVSAIDYSYKNLSPAILWTYIKAENADAHSMLLLAAYFENEPPYDYEKKILEKDLEQAVTWLALAAKLNSRPAIERLKVLGLDERGRKLPKQEVKNLKDLEKLTDPFAAPPLTPEPAPLPEPEVLQIYKSEKKGNSLAAEFREAGGKGIAAFALLTFFSIIFIVTKILFIVFETRILLWLGGTAADLNAFGRVLFSPNSAIIYLFAGIALILGVCIPFLLFEKGKAEGRVSGNRYLFPAIFFTVYFALRIINHTTITFLNSRIGWNIAALLPFIIGTLVTLLLMAALITLLIKRGKAASIALIIITSLTGVGAALFLVFYFATVISAPIWLHLGYACILFAVPAFMVLMMRAAGRKRK